jgi:hypothetical protein
MSCGASSSGSGGGGSCGSGGAPAIGPTCATCGVAASGTEPDGNPVRWVKTRRAASGEVIPEGRECYACLQVRLRCVTDTSKPKTPHEAGKKRKGITAEVSQQELLEKFSQDTELRNNFMALRLSKVARLAEGTRTRADANGPKLDLATYSTTRNKSTYLDMWADYSFVELTAFCQREARGHQFASDAERIRWCEAGPVAVVGPSRTLPDP